MLKKSINVFDLIIKLCAYSKLVVVKYVPTNVPILSVPFEKKKKKNREGLTK